MTTVYTPATLSGVVRGPANQSLFVAGSDVVVLFATGGAGAQAVSLDDGASFAEHALTAPAAADLLTAWTSYYDGTHLQLFSFSVSGGTTLLKVTSVLYDGTLHRLTTVTTATHVLGGLFDVLGPLVVKPSGGDILAAFYGAVGGSGALYLYSSASGTVVSAPTPYGQPTGIDLLTTLGDPVIITVQPPLLLSITVTALLKALAQTQLVKAAVGQVLSLQGLGGLDLVFGYGSALATVRYGDAFPSPIVLSGGQADSSAFCGSYDSGTGNAHVFFVTSRSGTRALYAARRAGGSWDAPILASDAGSVPLRVSCMALDPTGGAKTCYDTSLPAVISGHVSTFATPDPPLVTAPSGLITTDTPTVRWTYRNAALSDPQAAFQYQFLDAITPATVVFDSGEIASAASSAVYGGPALTPGQALLLRVRTRDALSAGGAGTLSSWSSPLSFTRVTAATVTLTSVTVGGVPDASSPVTVTGPSLGAHITYAQADGNHAASYELRVYHADTLTLAESGGVVAADIAPGAFVIPEHVFTTLLDGGTYFLAVKVVDAVTGASAESGQFELDVAYVPPAAPTGLVVTPDAEEGFAVLSWTNVASPTGTRVFLKKHELAEWTQAYPPLAGGPAISTITLYPCVGMPYDYRVEAVNAVGLSSAPLDAAVPVTLGYQAKKNGVWLNALTDMSIKAALGGINDWSSTKWEHQEDAKSGLPIGRSVPVTIWGEADWDSNPNFSFWIPAFDPDGGSGGTLGRTVADAVDRLARIKDQVVYRDPRGRQKICAMTQKTESADQGVHYVVTFQLDDSDSDAVIYSGAA